MAIGVGMFNVLFSSIRFFHFFLINFVSSRELTAEQKLLAVLRMLACGNFEQTAADYIGISQPTMRTILPFVCSAILRHFNAFVRMPESEEECLVKAAEFAAIAGFPRCIGAIDCTHAKIASPGGNIVSTCNVFFRTKLNKKYIPCTE